eukprot:1923828-Rhodomonas_salina.1
MLTYGVAHYQRLRAHLDLQRRALPQVDRWQYITYLDGEDWGTASGGGATGAGSLLPLPDMMTFAPTDVC